MAITCGFAALAAASEEDPVEAALTRLPASAPGPAFPDIPEVDMANLCRSHSGRQRYYPPRALSNGVEGRVVLDCVIRENAPRTCQVLYESPDSYGFGDAALRIACHFRVDEPGSDEGEPSGNLPREARFYRRRAEGEPWRARVPIRFQLR